MNIDHHYWQKQTPTNPLFPDIEWSKPEQKSRAGRLAIIGGNLHGFMSVAHSYQLATKTGAGQVRAVVPNALKKLLPTTLLDVVYSSSTISGGFAAGDSTLLASLDWSDVTLLIGDNGRSSETAIALEKLLETTKPMIITRDSVDLLKNCSRDIVNRDNTGLILSFAQLQKLFGLVYYPKILSFSMQLMLLVEALHKFTITYPIWIATFHQDNLIIAHQGNVVTSAFSQPLMIWRGDVAVKSACYWMWNLSSPLESVSCSIIN
jgi:hypothetical protein